MREKIQFSKKLTSLYENITSNFHFVLYRFWIKRGIIKKLLYKTLISPKKEKKTILKNGTQGCKKKTCISRILVKNSYFFRLDFVVLLSQIVVFPFERMKNYQQVVGWIEALLIGHTFYVCEKWWPNIIDDVFHNLVAMLDAHTFHALIAGEWCGNAAWLVGSK